MALFRRKKTEEQPVIQTPIQQEPGEPDNASKLKLHYPKDWEMTSKEKYIYQYHFSRLPKINEGQLSITGIRFLEVNGEIVVEALIQNTVPHSLKIQFVDLVLLDGTDEIAARKRFSLDHLGDFLPYSVTPWRFLFSAEDRLSTAPVSEQWKIEFQVHTGDNNEYFEIDFDQEWDEKLSAVQKFQLVKMLQELPKPELHEVNIVGADLRFLEDASLEAIIFIRNGIPKELQLMELPLKVEDAAGDIVCQGQFELPPLQVKARSAKPWVFIFPPDLILKQDPDFSRWKISISENNEGKK